VAPGCDAEERSKRSYSMHPTRGLTFVPSHSALEKVLKILPSVPVASAGAKNLLMRYFGACLLRRVSRRPARARCFSSSRAFLSDNGISSYLPTCIGTRDVEIPSDEFKIRWNGVYVRSCLPDLTHGSCTSIRPTWKAPLVPRYVPLKMDKHPALVFDFNVSHGIFHVHGPEKTNSRHHGIPTQCHQPRLPDILPRTPCH